jgi:hypothetical protein
LRGSRRANRNAVQLRDKWGTGRVRRNTRQLIAVSLAGSIGQGDVSPFACAKGISRQESKENAVPFPQHRFQDLTRAKLLTAANLHPGNSHLTADIDAAHASRAPRARGQFRRSSPTVPHYSSGRWWAYAQFRSLRLVISLSTIGKAQSARSLKPCPLFQ